jgi:hypothetical protein
VKKLVAVLVALAGCGAHPPLPRAAPGLGNWKTLTAEHRVTLDYKTKEGTREKRKLRGAIAVERPARFRLRALGPAGITLFDVLYDQGEVRVLRAVSDPSEGSTLGRIVQSMAQDIAAAYRLEPIPPERKESVDKKEVIISDPRAQIRLTQFVASGNSVAPARMEIDNHALDYRVTVEVVDLKLDEPLDPALFTPP